MTTITTGKSYRFYTYDDSKYLNILTDDAVTNNKNVTTYALDANDLAQVWRCEEYSANGVSGYLMKSKKNTSFALDRYRGSSNYNNADVYTIGTTVDDLKDQLVEFKPLSNGFYKIKLAYYDLYLTVSTTDTYGGKNVVWRAETGNTEQLWAAQEYGTSTGGNTSYTGILSRNTVVPTNTASTPYIITNIPDKQFSSGFDNNVEFHPGCGFANGTNFNNSSDGAKVKEVLQKFVKKVFGNDASLTDAETCYYLFGERFANGGNNDFHSGVDINYYNGAPIYSLYDGTVTYVGEDYGTVCVRNDTLGVTFNYLHMDDIKVAENQVITAGTLIGYESNATGAQTRIQPHLHFEVRPWEISRPAGLATDPNAQLTTILPYGYMDGVI